MCVCIDVVFLATCYAWYITGSQQGEVAWLAKEGIRFLEVDIDTRDTVVNMTL